MMFLQNAKMVSFCGQKVILLRNSFLKIPKRNGYLLLVPEIGEDLPGKYPLLKEDKSPEFNNVTIEKCIAAIGKQTMEFEEEIRILGKRIENVENVSPKYLFDNVLNPMEEMNTSLNITWGIAKTLYIGNESLMPTKCFLAIHERASRASNSRFVSIPIYRACKSIINNEVIKLTNDQRRVLTKYILEGKLNGLELPDKKKPEFTDMTLILLRRIKEYSQKLTAAVNHFNHPIVDPIIMKDFPEEVLKAMVKDTTDFNTGPWTVTLDPIIMKPFMEYCPDRTLRMEVWRADVIKASVLHDRSVQTSTVLENIRFDRNKRAKFLGYETYIDISMQTKMAGSLENVYSVLDNLLKTARPAQEYEIRELSVFAHKRGFQGALELWDIPYWSRKQMNSIYKYREEDFKNYFPLPTVLSGLFELIEMLFNVKFVENNKVDVWHKNVKFFDIFDLKESSTNPIAGVYLDFYARHDEKMRLRQHLANTVTIRERSKVSNTKPLVALVFNYQPPSGEKPSLLSFQGVKTLFQKFGHMLKCTLTTVEYADIAGISFVEWDAAFIPDYFLENWLRNPSVLQRISCHQDTREPLSIEMIQTLGKIESHLSGYNLCRELYLSEFDLELHHRNEFWNKIMNRLWKKYFVMPSHKLDSHICSFETIFSGEFAASYYSFVWSRMVAADLYNTFEEISIKDKTVLKEIGNRYRETFLALGGSCPTSEVFRKFRGRDPNPKVLLKHLELDTKSRMLEINSVKI